MYDYEDEVQTDFKREVKLKVEKNPKIRFQDRFHFTSIDSIPLAEWYCGIVILFLTAFSLARFMTKETEDKPSVNLLLILPTVLITSLLKYRQDRAANEYMDIVRQQGPGMLFKEFAATQKGQKILEAIGGENALDNAIALRFSGPCE